MKWQEFPKLNQPETPRHVVSERNAKTIDATFTIDKRNIDVRVWFGQKFLNTDQSKYYMKKKGNVSNEAIKVSSS